MKYVNASALLVGCFVAVLAFGQSTPPMEAISQDPDEVRLGADGCPAGAAEGGMGPEMVRLPEGFCIDTTEVKRGEYNEWASSASTEGQIAACSANDDFASTCGNENAPEQPAVCVDWCDARAFCEAAGKRLCGAIGSGDAYAFESYDDPAVSEWHAACTSGGTYEYTYGDEHNTDACRDGDADDYTTWGFGDVGEFEDCHSPDAAYENVYDLSGHVAEWDNSCDGDDAESACRIRGGSFEHQGRGLRCAMARGLRWPRTRRTVSVGFRCCAD